MLNFGFMKSESKHPLKYLFLQIIWISTIYLTVCTFLQVEKSAKADLLKSTKYQS